MSKTLSIFPPRMQMTFGACSIDRKRIGRLSSTSLRGKMVLTSQRLSTNRESSREGI